MKVPKYIREKMHRIAELNSMSAYLMRDVEKWLEKQGIDTSIEGDLRNGSGCSLEELEYGNDVTDLLCEHIETELKEMG